MPGLFTKILKKIEYLRPGIFVPKGALFTAKVGSQCKITIPQEVREHLKLKEGDRVVVYLRLPHYRFQLKFLHPLVYRLRPGLLFPKGLRFIAQIETGSWRFTVPKHISENQNMIKEGMEVEVYIRVFEEDVV